MNLYIGNLVLILIVAFLLKGIKDKEKRNKIFLYYSFIQMFLFLALRRIDVGIDLGAYLKIFNQCGNVFNIGDLFKLEREIGYLLYNYIVYKSFNADFHIFIVITAFISLIGPFFVIKKYSKNYFLSVYIFITFQFFIYDFFLLRQVIALSILLFAIKYVEERKIIPFVLLVILATVFHLSALSFIIVYFIYNIKIDNKKIIAISCIIMLLLTYGENIMKIIYGYTYGAYSDISQVGSGYGYLAVLIMVFAIVTLVRNGFFKNEKSNMFWYNILVIAVFLQTLTLKSSMVSRLNIYYTISLIIIIPNVLNSFKDKKVNILGELFIFVLLGTYFLQNLDNELLYQTYYFFWN